MPSSTRRTTSPPRPRRRCRESVSTLTAMAGMPQKEASVAAATVPEYQMLFPRLALGLIPETTRSGGRGRSSERASLTQSTGVPVSPVRPSPQGTTSREE